MERDRRQHPRASFASVRVLLEGEDGFRDEFVQDLSPGGLLLRTERTLPVGSRLEVRILRPDCKPLRLQAKVRRLEVALEGMPAMALEFVGLHEGADADLKQLVEPYVQAFRREVAELELRSNEALESGVERLRQQLESLDAVAVGIGLDGPLPPQRETQGRATSGDAGAPDEGERTQEAQSAEAVRLARVEAELEIVRERARGERALRTKVEGELSQLRNRLRQLEDVGLDKVELEEKLAESTTQLQHAQELVRRSSGVAREALRRLELLSRSGAAVPRETSAKQSENEDKKTASAEPTPSAAASQRENAPASRTVVNAENEPSEEATEKSGEPRQARGASLEPVVGADEPGAKAFDDSRSRAPSDHANDPDHPDHSGESDPSDHSEASVLEEPISGEASLPEREATLVPLGPEDEASTAGARADDPTDEEYRSVGDAAASRSREDLELEDEADESARDREAEDVSERSAEFDLDLSEVNDDEDDSPEESEQVEQESRGGAIALGAPESGARPSPEASDAHTGERDAGDASSDDEPLAENGEEPTREFVPLSAAALEAARKGRGAEYSAQDETIRSLVDNDEALDEDHSREVAGGSHGEKKGEPPSKSKSPAFEWQEEHAAEVDQVIAGLGPDQQVSRATEGRAKDGVGESEAPTGALSRGDLDAAHRTSGPLGSSPPSGSDHELPTAADRAAASGRSSEDELAPEHEAASGDSRSGDREALLRERHKVRAAPAPRAEKVEPPTALGPQEVPTREVFVEHLRSGLRLEKTERFHRLEPVSRADISVSDWLARTDEYGELAKLAEDLMSETELQRVLHLFFERGLLVLREGS